MKVAIETTIASAKSMSISQPTIRVLPFFHCHQQIHMDYGLMKVFDVV